MFDGYLAVREYVEQNPGALTKRLFPGIELRLEAPTDFRLNTHVLFDDAILPENLQNFLARLNIGGTSNKPPSRQNLIDLAKGFDPGKRRFHGYKDEDKADDDNHPSKFDIAPHCGSDHILQAFTAAREPNKV